MKEQKEGPAFLEGKERVRGWKELTSGNYTCYLCDRAGFVIAVLSSTVLASVTKY